MLKRKRGHLLAANRQEYDGNILKFLFLFDLPAEFKSRLSKALPTSSKMTSGLKETTFSHRLPSCRRPPRHNHVFENSRTQFAKFSVHRQWSKTLLFRLFLRGKSLHAQGKEENSASQAQNSGMAVQQNFLHR